MKLKNLQIVSILRSTNDEVWNGLVEKKLPFKVLYSMHRSLPKIKEAYAAYEKTLLKICASHGVTVDNLKVNDPIKQVMIQEEVTGLLQQEVEVEVHTFEEAELMKCGDGIYDSISINEYEHLAWMFE